MKLFIFKVGSDNRPATPEDLEFLQKQIEDFENKYEIDVPSIVTHHSVTVETVDLSSPTIFIDDDVDIIDVDHSPEDPDDDTDTEGSEWA